MVACAPRPRHPGYDRRVGLSPSRTWPFGASTWAAASAAIYLALNFGLGGGLPFVRFPAFAFPDTGGVMAVPLFLADGTPANPTDFTGFAGLIPEALDGAHPGLPSVVEHRFHETQAWIGGHLGTGGPVEITVGVRVLRTDAAGRIAVEDRVDGRGTASRAP